ncbi:hypothetical protein [Flavobacterium sp. W21_SRS_FM6]|uniref:hypothetical protein n=1 Tax=Flavobacterium sp. W21_SRS_FM6 TaxID=3240268 RepID=UPI003F9029CE
MALMNGAYATETVFYCGEAVRFPQYRGQDYQKITEIITSFVWREMGKTIENPNFLAYWMKT